MGTGTGKTLTSLFRVTENPTSKLLIICPHNVLEQWESVLMAKFSGFKPLQFKKSWTAAQKNKAILTDKDYNVVIVNFEVLEKLTSLQLLVTEDWTIIVDESHRIKTRYKTLSSKGEVVKATEAALKIGEKTPWKIILTATPTQKNMGGYIDYYPQLAFLGYIDSNFDKFLSDYCSIKRTVIWGVQKPVPAIVGYKNTEELDKILRMSCRRYQSKFGDFEPQHNKVMLEKAPHYAKTEREKSYNEIVFTNSSRKRIGLKTLSTGTIMGMDRYGVRYSYEDNRIKLDWIEDFLNDTTETVAIFYQYDVELESLKALCKKLGKKFIVINGATKNPYREINEKEYDVMLGQFQTASQSLDGLQHKCHLTVFFAMPESSIHYTQSLGRTDRDGQKQVPMYYYLIMKGTVDEDIYNMIESKVEFSEETLNKLLIKGEEP